jgi:dipeptidyl aminopeptidase/acylaminoacyl peptidase
VVYVNYKLAFLGSTELITFQSNDIQIEGLILRPEGTGPHPGVVLLQGAGGSHQGYNKWYNRFHANAFVEKGFAVLIYTKRGSGDNNVDYKYFTYKELMNDVVAAVNFFRNQPNIDENNIGLMGISESGWFTPEVAAVDGNIRFIINRVSSPFVVTKTVTHERRMDAKAEGFNEKEIEENIIPLTHRIWQFYIDVANDPSKANGSERVAINEALSEMSKHDRLKKWFTYSSLKEYDPKLYSSRGSNYSYDPLPYLKEIDEPMLYIMAGKDINMPTKSIVEFLNKFKQEANKDITIKVYPDAGHYLYRWNALPIEGLYEDGYLEFLSNWAKKQIE